MHPANLTRGIVLLLLLAFPGVQGSDADGKLEFSPPADFHGRVNATGLATAILYFEDAAAEMTIQLDDSAFVREYSWRRYDTSIGGLIGNAGDAPRGEPNEWTLQGPASLTLSSPAHGVAGIVIRAESINASGPAAVGQLGIAAAATCLDSELTQREHSQMAIRPGAAPCSAVPEPRLVLRAPSANAMELQIHGLEGIEWNGMDVTCSGTAKCPTGGTRERQKTDPVPGSHVNIDTFGYAQLTQTSGTATIRGLSTTFMGVAPTMNLAVSGQLRFPHAVTENLCGGRCDAGGLQTLHLNGTILLDDITVASSGTMAAKWSGTPNGIVLDEGDFTHLLPNARLNQIVGTALGIGAVLAIAKALSYVIGLNLADPLGNPVRRAVLRQIALQPGVTRTDLQAATGSTRTTIVHHVRILRRFSMIAEHRLGKIPQYTLSAPAATTSAETSSMRAFSHPLRRRIHELLMQNGPSTYQDVRRNWISPDPPSHPLFLYHMKTLLEGSAIRQETGRGGRLYAAIAANGASQQQVRHWLERQGFAPILAAATSRAAFEEKAIREACNSLDRRAVKRGLFALESVGVIEHALSGGYATLVPWNLSATVGTTERERECYVAASTEGSAPRAIPATGRSDGWSPVGQSS